MHGTTRSFSALKYGSSGKASSVGLICKVRGVDTSLTGTIIRIIIPLVLVAHTIRVGINARMDSWIVLIRTLRGETWELTVRITVGLAVVLSRSLALSRPVGLVEDMEEGDIAAAVGVAAEEAAVVAGEEAAVEAVEEEAAAVAVEEEEVVVVDMFIIG